MEHDRSIAVLAVVAVVLLAGCGGSGSGVPATTGAEPGPTTETETTTGTQAPETATTTSTTATDATGTTPTPTTTGSSETTTDTEGTTTPDPGIDTESYVFDHADVGGAAIEGGIEFPEGSNEPKYYATIVEVAGETERFDFSILTDDAASFVTDTDFERSYLVVVQTYPASSAPNYRVERAERSGDTLELAINDSAQGGTQDQTVETMLIRVPKDGPAPDRVTVTTEDGTEFDNTGDDGEDGTSDGEI